MVPHAEPQVLAWQGRTITGLLLMVIGFLLDWLPYISDLGGLLILIGAVLVFLGRHGFGEAQVTSAARGMALIVISFVATIGLAVWFVAALVGQFVQSTAGQYSAGPGVDAVLQAFLYGIVAVGVLGALGYAVLGWGLADRPTRNLLLVGFVAQVAVSVLLVVLLLPVITSVINQTIANPSSNPASGFQNQLYVYELVDGIPAGLFAWAYLRVRRSAIALSEGYRAQGGTLPG